MYVPKKASAVRKAIERDRETIYVVVSGEKIKVALSGFTGHSRICSPCKNENINVAKRSSRRFSTAPRAGFPLSFITDHGAKVPFPFPGPFIEMTLLLSNVSPRRTRARSRHTHAIPRITYDPRVLCSPAAYSRAPVRFSISYVPCASRHPVRSPTPPARYT